MKPLFASIILASVSATAMAQHGVDETAVRMVTASEQADMAGAPVKAPLPSAIEEAVLNDWFESELAGDVDESMVEVARRAYTQTMFEPIWNRDGARGLKEASNDLFAHGLAADDVLQHDIDRLIEQRFNAADETAKAKADLALTAAWIRITSAISGGLADEGSAADSNVASATYAEMPRTLISTGDGQAPLDFTDFESDYPQYAALKSALAKYRDIREAGGWFAIADGETIEAGGKDERIPAIRKRLAAEGFIEPQSQAEPRKEEFMVADAGNVSAVQMQDSSPEGRGDGASVVISEDTAATTVDPTLYSDELVEAVETFQARHGIKVDGVIGPNTLAVMNESVDSKIARIADSMERWRHQGQSDAKYIWANIPSYTVEGWDQGVREISMKSIVGTASRQTPTFNDEVEYTVANPRWYAPVSIVRKDKLPKLQRDPSYAKRANFKIYDRSTGAEVSAYSVNWNDPSSASQYRLVQQPGSSNALGELKIIFPNQYSVYLHGTPGKHLFDRAERAFSSGCIRLERPGEMAEWVAGQDSGERVEEVEAALSTSDNQRIDFESRLPIHITYMTVTVNDDGTVNFWRDIYDRTEGIEQVKKLAPLSRTASSDVDAETARKG